MTRMYSDEGKDDDLLQLELESTIGFEGHVVGGLHVHPDKSHLVYPLGNTIVVEPLDPHKKKQEFLSGHTNNVSCITLSRNGALIASGQITHMGFKADIIVWDYAKKSIYCRLKLHKVKVEALAFSPNGCYLASLGGQDDGSVVIWDLACKEAVCGAHAAVLSAGTTFCMAFANHSDSIFVTGGDKTLRVWELDVTSRLLRPTDCNTGQLKRIVKCIQVSSDDKYMYCGTTSGDILQINMQTKLLCHYGPSKDKFSQGVYALRLMKTGDILVGAGDGTVAIVKGDNYKRVKSGKIDGQITSVGLRGDGHQFFAGTTQCEIHRFIYSDFSSEKMSTCHFGGVLDISFPYNYSALFATCAKNDIRVWNASTSQELLRIAVPNMTCHAVAFVPDGKSIVSGWDDGKIRAFTPETGRALYTINDAHNKGVTALATTSDCQHIISGGGDGQVRVWRVSRSGAHKMVQALKEHKGTVTCIKVKKNDSECVTASTDGTCIVWDLRRFVRNQIIFANTMFKTVSYHPDECQIITAGTDRKIGYWENFDGSQIRELEGTKSGAINGLDISLDGVYFVTAGDDKLLRVWKYDEGEVTHLGIGHSGEITRVKICPSQKHIVSVSADGAVLRWKFPFPPS